MTAPASPSNHASPLASAQSLRQRHGRLSPLRLGIFGLVSLGSHLLLLGLFRWAWQVQLATQPVGSPIGIDFVEVDLSDGSFAGQLPDESANAAIPGGKLSAAQLNELIARGESAPTDAVVEAEVSELGQSKLGQSETFSDNSSADTVATANGTAVSETLGDTSQTNGGQGEPPRSWFPFGQSKEKESGGLFGDRPPLPSPTTNNSTTQPNRDSSNTTTTGEATQPSQAEEETGAIASESEPDTTPPPSNSSVAPTPSGTTATEQADSTSTSTDNAPASPGAGENQNSESGGGNTNGNPGRPNPLPPNMSEQPVSPGQTIQPGETAAEPVDSNSDAPAPEDDGPVAENPNGNDNPDNSSSGGSSGGGDGGGEAAETGAGANGAGEASSGSNESDSEASGGGSSTTGSETDNAVTRLGANLVVDEVQSRALNIQDVFTRLPKPIGDPLSGSQSVSSGRCAGQLAALTPASYGQPVQLRLAVDVNGDVFFVEGVDAAAQTAVGQAIACIAEEWPFEPAQRVINEGGVEKVEDAGAVLFVTVTISLRE